MAKDDDRKELWVGWSQAALETYEPSEEFKDTEDLIDDMADFSALYADAMLEEFDARFTGGKSRRRSRRSKEPEESDR